MGQSISSEECELIRRNIYAHYVGLEQQLEMAFSCHDIDQRLILPYETLEPVLRHLLMQYGLIEYVTRFTNENGALDPAHVSAELTAFGVTTKKFCSAGYLSCEDFKSMAVVWLKKILDTYADDQAEWEEKLRQQQEAQSEAYNLAMSKFQEQYVNQQAIYKQGIVEQERQVNEWNKILEDTQRTQEEVYMSEIERMNEIKRRQENAESDIIKEQNRIVNEYATQISSIAAKDKNGICFTYPTTATPFGSCVSAGAQEPIKRKKKTVLHQKKTLGFC